MSRRSQPLYRALNVQALPYELENSNVAWLFLPAVMQREAKRRFSDFFQNLIKKPVELQSFVLNALVFTNLSVIRYIEGARGWMTYERSM